MDECLEQPCATNFEEAQRTDCYANETEPDITVYPAAELPVPYGIEDKENEIIFLDPTIGEGKRIVNEKATSIPHLFALIRQFIRPVCHNIGLITDEMLRRGVSINDVDATTGMSILHYAVRATVLAEKRGLVIVKRLLSNGADPRQRCLFSGMNALHIAAYFDIASVVKLLLKPCKLWPLVHVNSLCDGFDFGSSLHIAASCLSSNVVETLLQKGASPVIKDDLGRTPIQCLPTNFTSAEDHKRAKYIKEILSKYSHADTVKHGQPQSNDLTIGSKVVLSYNETDKSNNAHVVRKRGTLRFIGKLPKSTDDWAGIELDTSDGENSGEIGKKVYFQCKVKRGVFVRLSMVHPLINDRKSAKTSYKRVKDPSSSSKKCRFKIGDRVLVAGTMEGVVRFIGETQFASGVWCGVELDTAGPGRNNGSVGDVSYFTCPPSRGVFSPPSKLELLSSDHTSSTCDSAESTGNSGRRTRSPKCRSDRSTTRSFPVTHASYPLSSRTRLHRFEDRSDHSFRSSYSGGKITSSESDHSYLHPGMRVNVSGTERSGIIKFVGETEFASGFWVGLDMGVPQGRNDGSVQGRRYFRCPPLYGLMVRPHRVTYNGVSGASLLPTNHESQRSPRK